MGTDVTVKNRFQASSARMEMRAPQKKPRNRRLDGAVAAAGLCQLQGVEAGGQQEAVCGEECFAGRGGGGDAMLVDESTSHEAMELDESTLAVLNPSTQDDALMASPAERRTLSQPTSSELTPGGVNLLHRLEEATPRRTHVASAEYKAAAATPEGEEAEARERLARGGLQRSGSACIALVKT